MSAFSHKRTFRRGLEIRNLPKSACMETQKEANARYDTGCTNGAASTGIRIGNGLVDRSLQCLAGLEFRHILGGNLNPLTRPRVAACGGVTMTNAKGTEANETDFIASSEGGSN